MVQLVGILNVTPDSFSDGGQYMSVADAMIHAEQLFLDGASLIDIGAESTRPGAIALTSEQERQRLEPILPELAKLYPGKLSLDTYHPETVAWALDLAPFIINDVTGMNNPAMLAVISDRQASCIVSHLQGHDVQAVHQGELIDDISIVVNGLLTKKKLLEAAGLRRDQVILDPGIGFGKTAELNAKLLEFAQYVPGSPVMIGYSRKRFLGEDRLELEPNLLAGWIAARSGATYLRVHDVAGHHELLSS